MENDNKVNIDIHTQATGDGAKKTIEDMGSLRDKINSVDNISDEARESLHGLVDQLDDLKQSAGMATSGSTKLGRAEKKVGDEAKKEARSLDKVNKELVEAKRNLAAASIGSQQFERAQARVNELSKEYSRTMPRAAKSTRNLGFAAMEGSRALEDLQYGIGGVVNNIPQMVMFMGGSAGLTALISLMAVGMNQLSINSKKTSKAMAVSADDLEGAEERKREALKKTNEQINAYAETIEEATRIAGLEKESIDNTTKALKQQAKNRAEIALAQVDLALAENQNSDKSEAKKLVIENALLAQKAKLTQQAGAEQVQLTKDGLKANRERLRDDQTRYELMLQTADSQKKEAVDLKESIELTKEYTALRESQVEDALKGVSSRRLTNKGLGSFKGETATDDYIKYLYGKAAEFAKSDNRGANVSGKQIEAGLKKYETAQAALIKNQEKLNSLENDSKRLKADASANEDAAKAGLEKIDSEWSKQRRFNKELEATIEHRKQLDTFKNKTGVQELKAESGKVGAGTAKGVKSAGDLSRFGDEDSEVKGSSKADKDFNKGRISTEAKKIAEIVKGGVDGSEFKPLIQALENMKSAMAEDNTQGLEKIQSLLDMVTSQRTKYEGMQKQINDSISAMNKLHGAQITKIKHNDREIGRLWTALAAK